MPDPVDLVSLATCAGCGQGLRPKTMAARTRDLLTVDTLCISRRQDVAS